MAADRDYARFFTYFNLFIFFMLALVLAESLLLMFVGWEGVGLCSYLLIAFWYEDPENSKAGNKAFIVNRVGDVGFALGILLVFTTFGTLSFHQADHRGFLDLVEAGRTATGPLTAGIATAIALLLFVGACGKSAQFPLHIWLPDAMAGPTPVSALIHAATMVTAGVVMVTRVSPVYVASPTAMLVVSCVGLFTALFAATIALTQNDIKKVLAYSTVSQLGYMFLGCGVGAFSAGMFHVTTHAFFKALLFLGAGSVIHALSGEQDMRKMGGLKSRIPITHWTMFAGWVAIAGIPPFAGFWSKDEILGAASGFPGYGMAFYLLGVGTAGLTAFYMSRLMWKTFYTAPRFVESELGSHGHGGPADDSHGHAGGVHESPPSMWIPLVVLAVLSVVGGFLNVPFGAKPEAFGEFMRPSVAAHEAAQAVPPALGMLIGTIVAAIGLALAWVLYSKARESGSLVSEEVKAANPLFRAASNLWYVDRTLFAVFVTGGGRLATGIWDRIDRALIDGLVNLLAAIVGLFSELFRRVQTGYIRAYTLTMMCGVVAVVASILYGLLRR
jgi:NADH-quinone oxidoreductase subunit L